MNPRNHVRPRIIFRPGTSPPVGGIFQLGFQFRYARKYIYICVQVRRIVIAFFSLSRDSPAVEPFILPTPAHNTRDVQKKKARFKVLLKLSEFEYCIFKSKTFYTLESFARANCFFLQVAVSSLPSAPREYSRA